MGQSSDGVRVVGYYDYNWLVVGRLHAYIDVGSNALCQNNDTVLSWETDLLWNRSVIMKWKIIPI